MTNERRADIFPTSPSTVLPSLTIVQETPPVANKADQTWPAASSPGAPRSSSSFSFSNRAALPADLLALRATCLHVHRVWLANAPALIWSIWPRFVVCFDEALIAVRNPPSVPYLATLLALWSNRFEKARHPDGRKPSLRLGRYPRA